MATKKKILICAECGEVEHSEGCDLVTSANWKKRLILQELLDLPEGGEFIFKGERARVVSHDKVRFLISKGDPKSDPPTSDMYFRSDSVFFRLTESGKPVTLSSCFPSPKILRLAEFERL